MGIARKMLEAAFPEPEDVKAKREWEAAKERYKVAQDQFKFYPAGQGGDLREIAQVDMLRAKVEMLEAGLAYERFVADSSDPLVPAASPSQAAQDMGDVMALEAVLDGEFQSALEGLWQTKWQTGAIDRTQLAKLAELAEQMRTASSLCYYRSRYATTSRNKLASLRQAAGLPAPESVPHIERGTSADIRGRYLRHLQNSQGRGPSLDELDSARNEFIVRSSALEARVSREASAREREQKERRELDGEWDRRQQVAREDSEADRKRHEEENRALRAAHAVVREKATQVIDHLRKGARDG